MPMEKQDWAQSASVPLRRQPMLRTPLRPPTADEIEAWARREQIGGSNGSTALRRTRSTAWARQQATGFLGELANLPLFDDVMRSGIFDADVSETAEHHLLRDAELASKGALYVLSRAPLRLWSYFVRSG